MEFTQLLTVGGASALVVMLLALLKTTMPSFNSDQFGPITAVALGIGVVLLANFADVGDLALEVGPAIFTGLLAGLSAAGLYDNFKSGVAIATNE